MSGTNLTSNTQPPPYVLFFAMLTIGMGQTVIYAVMPALGRELALDQIVVHLPILALEWQPGKMAITSLSAMTALVFALVAPFWGRRSDSVGRRQVILTGLLGYTLGTFAFNAVAYMGMQGMVSGLFLWFLLVAARVAHAMVMSATFPAANAYMIDITATDKRAGGLGKISAANQMGVLLGPALAGAVVFGFLTPLYFQAFLTFCAAVLVYLFLAESKPPSKGADSAGQPLAKRLRMFDPRYRFILPTGFLLYTMQGMAQQTLAFYCEDVVGLTRVESVKYYAFAMMASSITMLCAQLTIVQRSRLNPVQLMRLGLPFCACGYGAIALTGNIEGVFLGMALFGFGVGMVVPGFTTCASLSVSAEEQGNLAGITGKTAGLGFVVGPLMGGLVYNLSTNLPFVIASSCLCLLAIYIYRSRRFSSIVPS